MFHILAWRWPFLALFVAAVFYIGRYYTIAGIEHLHLKPRENVAEVDRSSPSTPSSETESLWVTAGLQLGAKREGNTASSARSHHASNGN